MRKYFKNVFDAYNFCTNVLGKTCDSNANLIGNWNNQKFDFKNKLSKWKKEKLLKCGVNNQKSLFIKYVL